MLAVASEMMQAVFWRCWMLAGHDQDVPKMLVVVTSSCVPQSYKTTAKWKL